MVGEIRINPKNTVIEKKTKTNKNATKPQKKAAKIIIRCFVLMLIVFISYYGYEFYKLIQDKFSVKKIVLISNLVTLQEVTKQVPVNKKNIFLLNIKEISREITKINTAISDTSVRILPPSTVIIITEKKLPKAIFFDKNKTFLVDESGSLIEEAQSSGESNHISLYGKSANLHYSTILKDIKENTSFYNNVSSLQFINERRWNVILDKSIMIELPETNVVTTLKKLNELTRIKNPTGKIHVVTKKYNNDIINAYNTLDCRIHGRIYLKNAKII